MPKPNITKLAARWNASTRTIERWIADGAPVGSPKKMLTWLATRKHLPHGTRELVASHKRTVASDARAATTTPEEVGAASALGRLEKAESAAYAELQAALKANDPIAIKLARDGWLAIGNSLRKYDLNVEQLRRRNTEMVSRETVEKFVASFAAYWKLAIVSASNRFGQTLVGCDAAAICEAVKHEMIDAMMSVFATQAAQSTPSQLPNWMLRAAVSPIQGSYADAQEVVTLRIAEIRAHIEAQPATVVCVTTPAP